MQRIPNSGLPERFTVALRTGGNCSMPYRIDIAGTWIAALCFYTSSRLGYSLLISGAQDTIGICMLSLVRDYYDNVYWSLKFANILDENILSWLESHIQMVLLWPCELGLDVIKETYINKENVKTLANAPSARKASVNYGETSIICAIAVCAGIQ